ncbi:hypothetical protein EMCRGX_G022708, partial [Ephydatia muelleri]
WFALQQAGVAVPSFSAVKRFQLPGLVPPQRVLSSKNSPFYVISLTSVISQCLGSKTLSTALVRYPVLADTCTELYHGKKWNTDKRFASPMTVLNNGMHVFVRDCVCFLHPDVGFAKGIVVRFFQLKSNPQLFCEIYTLVDFNSFLLLVPGSQCFIPNGIDIIFDSVVVPVSSIFAFYDTSGNKCKKWNKFECWYLLFGGLSRHDNAKPQNIHFISCTNEMDVLDMTEPIAQQLTLLETEGVVVYDAYYEENVLVIAPLLCHL